MLSTSESSEIEKIYKNNLFLHYELKRNVVERTVRKVLIKLILVTV